MKRLEKIKYLKEKEGWIVGGRETRTEGSGENQEI